MQPVTRRINGLSNDAYITGLLEMNQLLNVAEAALNEKSGGKVKIGMVELRELAKVLSRFTLKLLVDHFSFTVEQRVYNCD